MHASSACATSEARSGISENRAPASAAVLVEQGEQLFLMFPGTPDDGACGAPLLSRRPFAAPSEVLAMVASFHRAFGLPRQAVPSLEGIERDLLALRTALLDEETAEFAEAANRRDLIAMADALADVVYVAYGTAVTLGVDLDAVLREVHRSNMSKLDERGRPVLRDDGKVLKSPRYTRPDIGRVLEQQLPLPFFA
jgi:predicted HAD superfamily Cof-like phosphohydrolase